MKFILGIQVIFLTVTFSGKLNADVFESWEFKPVNGSLQETIAWFDQAKPLHEELGAKVEYWQHDVMGNNVIAYVMRFDSGDDWAVFKDKLAADEAWLSWFTDNYGTFSANLIESFFVGNASNTMAKSDIWDDINVIGFSAWEPVKGKPATICFESMQKSAEIQEKFGLNPAVYSSGLGPGYFMTGGKTWTEYQESRNKRNESKEWTEYWTAAGENAPACDFVRQAFAVRVQ